MPVGCNPVSDLQGTEALLPQCPTGRTGFSEDRTSFSDHPEKCPRQIAIEPLFSTPLTPPMYLSRPEWTRSAGLRCYGREYETVSLRRPGLSVQVIVATCGSAPGGPCHFPIFPFPLGPCPIELSLPDFRLGFRTARCRCQWRLFCSSLLSRLFCSSLLSRLFCSSLLSRLFRKGLFLLPLSFLEIPRAFEFWILPHS